MKKLKADMGLKNQVAAVDATKIALEVLGLPITNTTMLGSLLKASQVVNNESVIHPLQKRFGRIAQKNITAFERAYQDTVLI